MKKLLNLTNCEGDNGLLNSEPEALGDFLDDVGFDGIEMMFCGPWDKTRHAEKYIIGSHLPFYPNWMDFWMQNSSALMHDFKNDDAIIQAFGSVDPTEWVKLYGERIATAAIANPKYMVFHVANVRYDEVFNWGFHYSDEEVIEETLKVLTLLEPYIPPNVWLLLENLWWPGLRLTNVDLANYLVKNSPHKRTGIMLDTGHLMGTNQALRTENEGVEYILECMKDLGELVELVKGIHLHQSLSGEFLDNFGYQLPDAYSWLDMYHHVNHIDYHASWTTNRVREIIDYVDPDWLVFEFLQRERKEWKNQIEVQRKALWGY